MFATLKITIYSAILATGLVSVGIRAQVNDISDDAAEFRELMWEDLMKLRALIRDALLLELVQLLLSCNLLQNAVSIVVTTLES